MVNHITLKPDEEVLADEAATLACGGRFAAILQPGLVVFLHGDLGAGKTTFVRGVLRGLGHVGKVKSPTYTLLEPYEIELNVISKYYFYHFDLYRFNSEEEWDAAGFRDYFNSQSICMIEWPEKAEHVLPTADIHVKLSLFKLGQNSHGRKIQYLADSPLGKSCLQKR